MTVQYWWTQNEVDSHPNANMYFKPKAGLVKFQTIAEGDDKKKCYKRLHRWRFSPTAAYGNNSLTDAFKTIGNGVPFLAAKGIAQTLFEYLNNSKYDSK